MKISDIFSAVFQEALRLLADLIRFVVQPRSYFVALEAEDNLKLVRRFVFYWVMFEIVSYSILKAAFHSSKSFDQFAFLGIAMMDFVLALLLLPAFTLTALVMRKSFPLRTSMCYVLTFKVVYAIVPLLFYAFFLMTENYSLAILRAIVVFIFLLGNVLLFPILFATGVRKRIFAVLATLGGVALTIAVIVLEIRSESDPLAWNL